MTMKKWALSGLIAVGLGIGAVTAQADDGAADGPMSECVFLATGPVVKKSEKITEGKAELTKIPKGWTPVSGIAVPRSNGMHGSILLCR